MKNLVYLLLCIPMVSYANADPQEIPTKLHSIYSLHWYQEQAAAWEQKAIERSDDPDAWLNFYMAEKYGNASPDKLQQIEVEMEKNVGSLFQTYLVKAWNLEWKNDAFQYLQSAYQLRPNDPHTYSGLLMFYELKRDLVQKKIFAEKIFASSFVPQGLLNYGYNVLMSVGDNGILFTQGENTTIPLWVLQEILNIRKDVTILNIDLIEDEGYRQQVFLEEQIKWEGSQLLASTNEQFISSLLQELPEENPTKQFYYALTLPNEQIDLVRNQLYIVGLTSRASSQHFDNIAIIKRNLEKQFLLDYVKVNFNGENEFATSKVLSQNYLLPIILLNEHYQISGETEKADEWKALALKIASERNRREEVEAYIKQSSVQQPLPLHELDIKSIEKNFKQVKDNLYASAYECTNKSYWEFLDYLRNNNLEEDLKICDFDFSSYQEPALSFMKKYLLNVANPRNSKNSEHFDNFPVMNISYEAVLKYCEWLTKQYNSNPDRSHNKVLFRLPILKEWQIAAFGYKGFTSWNIQENTVLAKEKEGDKPKDKKQYNLANYEVSYPWWSAFDLRNSPVNRLNCYLGNFKTPDTQLCPSGVIGDGWTITSSVGAFFPNEMGLYDVVGNVSEMISEKGKACGGSWNHVPEESTIHSINEYSEPNSFTGFRVFMEVIND